MLASAQRWIYLCQVFLGFEPPCTLPSSVYFAGFACECNNTSARLLPAYRISITLSIHAADQLMSSQLADNSGIQWQVAQWGQGKQASTCHAVLSWTKLLRPPLKTLLSYKTHSQFLV